jgi:hypothetical protein
MEDPAFLGIGLGPVQHEESHIIREDSID